MDEQDRLHVEGAPGLADSLGRLFMGDAGYEAQQAQAEVNAAKAALDHADQRARYRAVTSAIAIATMFAVLILMAVTIAAWRWALA